MEGAVALVLALLAIPFVLPLISWVMARRVRARVDNLEVLISRQDERITRLTTELAQLKKQGVAAPAPAQPVAAAPAPPQAPPVVAPPVAPARPPITVTPPVMQTPPAAPPPAAI